MTKILIVEDDQQLREMLKQLLEGESFEVIDSGDGEEAIKTLHENEVDLMITDIIMPEKDGVSLVRDLRKQFPDLKIIAISGGSRHIDPQNPLKIVEKMGVDRTLTKPFKLSELLDVVRELVPQ
jgi:DNA-binding response OmpR family regulator